MQNTGKSASVMVSDDVADTRRRFAAIVAGLLLGIAEVLGPRRAGIP